jgi:phage tail tape-measure protein
VSSLKTSIVIDLVNRVTEPIRRISRSFEGLRRAAGPALTDVNTRASALAGSVGSLVGKLTLLGGAGIWAFKSQFVDTASQFEQFTAILETVEGGSDKARRSMDWVSDFAAKTPYELAEVTDAFVKLRAYGMDPMNGLLKSMGDTSAAMGKPLMQAVEAVADAVTGEYERLKEFGVKADTKGNRVRFNYTDKDGKQQFKTVDKRNRQMIQSTLEAIWNEKYAGAMDKQSRTWRGMVSNLSDQWTRFKVKVMQAGVFDWMKGKLSDLLARVDKMAADGSLDRYARMWSVDIKAGMLEAWRVGTELWRGFKQIKEVVDQVAVAVGGYDNLLKMLAITMASKVFVEAGLLSLSLVKLGSEVIPLLAKNTSTLTSNLKGLGLALAPVAKVAAVLYGIHEFALKPLGMGIPDLQKSGEIYQDSVNKMAEMLSGKRDWKTGGLINAQPKISAELKVTFDHKNQNFSVTKLKSSHGFDVETDTGRLMVAPR